jgi:hypothetical protein
MPDYNNGKIYMICPKTEYDEGDVYFGSTTQTLSKRMVQHRSNNCNIKILVDKYGLENLKIELVCEIKCETKEQLNKEEGKYIRENKCVNKDIAGRTPKEYYIDNKDKKKEYRKVFYQENKEQINEKRKIYYEKNKEQINKKRNEKYINKKQKT